LARDEGRCAAAADVAEDGVAAAELRLNVGAEYGPADDAPLLRCMRSVARARSRCVRGVRAEACVAEAVGASCDGVSLTVDLLELRYVPTFYVRRGGASRVGVAARAVEGRTGPAGLGARSFWQLQWDKVLLGLRAVDDRGLWSGHLGRGSSLATPFEIAGTGRFLLRVFPAGDEDAPKGHCSVLLLGPPGVTS
jgi:hypothetical protein